MKFRRIKLPSIALGVLLLTGLTVSSAYAWNYSYRSDTFYTNSTPVYASYNTAAYNQMGYYQVDGYSSMHVACSTDIARIGEINSQAAFTIGKLNGDEYAYLGPSVTNDTIKQAGSYVTSECEATAVALTDAGIMAWGMGWGRSDNGVPYDVGTDYFILGTLQEWGPVVPGIRATDVEGEWVPGSNNFTDAAGLLYGVPCVDEAGFLVIPDMLRVELSEGAFGYVSVTDVRMASVGNEAEQADGRQAGEKAAKRNAEALQTAFEQYYGVSALDYDDAAACISLMRYENGYKKAAAWMESCAGDALASAINNGTVSRENALKALPGDDEKETKLTANPGQISITEDTLRTIMALAAPQMSVSVPAYASDGKTIIGAYSFVSF